MNETILEALRELKLQELEEERKKLKPHSEEWIKNLNESFNLDPLDDDDFDTSDIETPDNLSLAFGEEVRKWLQDLIDEELKNEDITESFKNHKKLKSHFKKHCLNSNKKSKPSNVLYDFKNEVDYENYEKTLVNSFTNLSNSSNEFLFNLTDVSLVESAFTKLLRGSDNYLIFLSSCGFENTGIPVNIIFHSPCNETKNYSGNTVDLEIVKGFTSLNSNSVETLSLFPLDKNKIETKFNNIIQKYNKYKNISYITVKP